MRRRRGVFVFVSASAGLALVLAAGAGCRVFDSGPQPDRQLQLLPGQQGGVFTTARPTFGAAFADFMARHPDPVQPLDFPHNVHAGKQIACAEYCHEGVTTGAVAGLPSIRTCMICHNAIATDRPRIQRITEMREKGLDLHWQRVFDYPAESHVRFNHAPHIRAEVACQTCHGNIAGGTVAQRNVQMTMGFCVNCHNEQKASIECVTCHN